MPILLGALSQSEIEASLRSSGLGIDLGNFRCRISCDTGLLSGPLRLLYADYPAELNPQGVFDFRVDIRRLRHGFRYSEVEFAWEGDVPFPSLPIGQTHPLFEWGMNWCVATLSGADIVIHSAVVERQGKALVLPGQPGAGKSTLSAALALSDWRLLSDELTVIVRDNGLVRPIPRPISLKGESIRIIQTLYPDAVVTDSVADTRKGEIAYVQPPKAAVSAFDAAVPIGWIVFPRFQKDSKLEVNEVSRAYALACLLENTFNVGLLGDSGFTSFARAIAAARCFEITYSDLSDVMRWLETECLSAD